MPINGQFQDLTTLPASDINTLLSRGYGNRIINGAFVINQRAYASGTNLAAGVYGFDRWKSAFTNTALTFTAGVQDTTVTISTSGVIQQIIERENVPAGTYTLSWSGTATGRVYNAGASAPAYAASPIIVSLNGLANVVVEFTAVGGTRTCGQVQLEGGDVFSPFQYRHRGEELALCQRYYQRYTNTAGDQAFMSGVFFVFNAPLGPLLFPVMRTAPTITFAGSYDLVSGGLVAGPSSLTAINITTFSAQVSAAGVSGTQGQGMIIRQDTGFYDMNSEL